VEGARLGEETARIEVEKTRIRAPFEGLVIRKDAEVGEVVAADPDAVVLVSFDEGSRILRTAVEQGIGPTVKNWYGVDGNMGNALGENFDAGT
jgi:hypothetical protein